MTSLLLPTAYLGGCIAAMSIFSHVYRRAKNAKAIEPWFPTNQKKEQYIALLNTEEETSEHHLKAALLGRAMEAVRRLLVVQQEKPALIELMRSGHIGEDIWRDFQTAEQETMVEVQEVLAEANTYAKDWQKTIFSTASQMLEAEKQKEANKEVQLMREREEKRWAMELQSEQLEDNVLNRKSEEKMVAEEEQK
ncbi:Sec62/63 complex, subunit Sec66 [Zychaea mexicana]|uniref:Sec62/63 complex, subunit Sec66 n=1 Tax=Zychaea mexicana TaxID=64656 RepID=UPI0022FE0FCA|nr:Sec62/63 complex, subunit Sec66 [Zychaea mexicana]KAI9496888.1 Sec62/63 complex, subunit Sec66 [Zychaea mexicana]